jgi:superoxide dismutase, Cu-Zn family
MEAFKLTTLALSTVLSALAVAQDTHRTPETVPQEGVAVLTPTKGQQAQGVLLLKQTNDGVQVTGKVSGLEPGEHGFHIHEFGDLRDPEGKSAGGHFNPDGHKHGGPEDAERHAGDLGNITADAQGVAQVKTLAKGLKLHFVIGRAMVVHGKADDLKSQPSGDAGPRVAVGVIGFAEVKQTAGGTRDAR